MQSSCIISHLLGLKLDMLSELEAAGQLTQQLTMSWQGLQSDIPGLYTMACLSASTQDGRAEGVLLMQVLTGCLARKHLPWHGKIGFNLVCKHLPWQGKIALGDLGFSRDVMQGSELHNGVLLNGWVKVIISCHIGHAVMVQQGRHLVDAAASDATLALQQFKRKWRFCLPKACWSTPICCPTWVLAQILKVSAILCVRVQSSCTTLKPNAQTNLAAASVL